LFEIATDEPGFAIDEEQVHLGELLKLPDWAESSRDKIEAALAPVTVNAANYV
jgi:glyoxalase family protein